MLERETQDSLKENPQKPSRILNREATEFIRTAVPDRYPTKQSRIGVDKSELMLDVVFSPIDVGNDVPPIRIQRDSYPRIERYSDGTFAKESVMDKPYTIWFGNEPKPYFLNNYALKIDGRECDEESYELIHSVIKTLKEGVGNGDVTVANFRTDNKIDSPTLSKQVLLFESS